SVAAGADPTAGASLDPEAVSADLLEGGDPRSEGEGPGLSGAPLLILLAVVGLGLATALVTVLFARLSRRT
ncbi:MAG: hypothetical protein ABFS37_15545, partial [Acidobacteriota bacterium]